jgi:hypothetical protein
MEALDPIVVQVGGAVVRVIDSRAWDGPKELQVRTAIRVLLISTREEYDDGVPQHRRLEGFEDGVSTQEREEAP